MSYPSYHPAAEVNPAATDEDAPLAVPRYATLEDFLQPGTDAASTREEDYKMDSGLVVRIRPLSRAEALKVNSMKGLDLAGKEQHYLARAMVEPRMTPANVKTWQERGLAGDIGDLVARVQFISGLSEKGEKAAAEEFPRSGE